MRLSDEKSQQIFEIKIRKKILKSMPTNFQCNFQIFALFGGTCLAGVSDLFIHCKKRSEVEKIAPWVEEEPYSKEGKNYD